MSSLDEQLALFEKEMLSVDEEKPKPDMKTDQPIQEPEIGGSSQPSNANPTKFVPHQLQHKSTPTAAPTQNFSHGITVPYGAVPSPSAVIESGPTLYSVLYAPDSSTSTAASTSKTSANSNARNEPISGSFASSSSIHQQQFKTQALPSDVELLMAKKQASKAHENSYLGAVLRGEKKMKRFLRSCGGQTWEDASMAEWDPNDFRIFTGDLGNEVSDELLAKAFRKYPSFQKAKVVRDSRTNKSKGYGFVSFRNQEDFIRAMKEMDGKYVGNRPIKLRKSNWKDRNSDIVKKKNKEKKKLGLL